MEDETDLFADVEIAKAEQFLNLIRNDPFLAIVISDGRVRVYKKADITQAHLSLIQEALAGMIEGD